MRVITAIIISLCIVSAVSGLLATAGWLFGINFWITFLVASAAQLVIGALWNTYIENKSMLEREAIMASNRLANSMQVLQLSCAYCGVTNIAEVAVAKENKFDCTSCHSTNKIQMSFTTTRITEPVVKDKVLSEIFKTVQEAPDANNIDSINDSKIEITGGTNE